ncbi:MAG: SpoVA/SpoVAEb family sporulation membrane protein [Spirochaetaceae bacterium]|jgi:hypothetical protein|nr:SpoVA/SpoVAEb family sporulation membrane protein [Spirochaetaceae bacterium]
MNVFKALIGAFIVGGIAAVIGQGLMVFWGGLLGPTIFVDLLSLVCLGLIGGLLVILGLYPKVEQFGGIGAGLTFGGFCAVVGSTFAAKKGETGSSGEAAKAAVSLVMYVIGTGVLLSFLVAVISWFVKGGAI